MKQENVLICALSAVLGYFEPIKGVLFASMSIFVANFVSGLLASLIVQKESFDFKKFFKCVAEAFVICGIIAFVLFIGDRIDNHDGAMSAISVVVYSMLYFYGVNILKNIRRLFPENRLIHFLWYVISFEIMKKIPYMSDFLHDQEPSAEKK